jgi:hypothetical protein
MVGGDEIKDTSRLSDADWAEINKLRRAYDSGGDEALKRAYKDLCKGDPIRWVRVMGAYFPDYVREKLKDAMADLGMTIEDLRDMIRKSESPSSSKHWAYAFRSEVTFAPVARATATC